MITITFDKDQYLDYRKSMEELFPFFRMFIADDVDAIITHMLSTNKLSLSDLRKVSDGLMSSIKKIAVKYPSKVPHSMDAKLKIPKNLSYEGENLSYHIVFNLTHALIHLQACTATFIALIEENK